MVYEALNGKCGILLLIKHGELEAMLHLRSVIPWVVEEDDVEIRLGVCWFPVYV